MVMRVASVADSPRTRSFFAGSAIPAILPKAEAALTTLRAHPLGRDAARIGTATATHPGDVFLRTRIGAHRALLRPHGELLPRIC